MVASHMPTFGVVQKAPVVVQLEEERSEEIVVTYSLRTAFVSRRGDMRRRRPGAGVPVLVRASQKVTVCDGVRFTAEEAARMESTLMQRGGGDSW